MLEVQGPHRGHLIQAIQDQERAWGAVAKSIFE
jgi:hypothetical protein